MNRISALDSPDWQQMNPDDLLKHLTRIECEFGDRILLVLSRQNRRHVERLLSKLRQRRVRLPTIIVKGHPNG